MSYLEIYVCTNMHVATINENKGHGFKRQYGWIYVRVWKEGREGRKYIIILESQK